MEFFATRVPTSDFLSHHGVKGMKWGVWNAETKLKYGIGSAANGARKVPNGMKPQNGVSGAGGGGVLMEESEHETPEKLLADGKIDEETAEKLRAELDRCIERMENGELSEESYALDINAAYEKYGLKPPYNESDIKKAINVDRVWQATGKNPHTTSEAEQYETLRENKKKNTQRYIDARKNDPSLRSDFAESFMRGVAGGVEDAMAIRDVYAAKTPSYSSGKDAVQRTIDTKRIRT